MACVVFVAPVHHYTVRELDQAVTILVLLGRGDLWLCPPPARKEGA